MQELSLNILDIAENSVKAGASLITVAVCYRPAADRLTVTITDDGCGMDAETVRRVCDPFYTTRTTRRVGMGLPLWKMAAEMTGGAMTVESAPGGFGHLPGNKRQHLRLRQGDLLPQHRAVLPGIGCAAPRGLRHSRRGGPEARPHRPQADALRGRTCALQGPAGRVWQRLRHLHLTRAHMFFVGVNTARHGAQSATTG